MEIGSTHRVCQDYALTSPESYHQYPTAIICDGCSDSENVDVGARILAHIAMLSANVIPHSQPLVVGDFIIQQADRVIQMLGLDRTALDATLLIAVAQDTGRVTINMWGDGVAVIRSAGRTEIIHVNFPSGAPAYLSYGLSKSRTEGYANEFGLKRVVTIIRKYDTEQTPSVLERQDTEVFKPLAWTTCAPEYVLLASDGVNSFEDEHSVAIDYHQIVRELTAFKSLTGEFIRRRMNFFNRKMRKENNSHYDDLSIAGISFEQPRAETETAQLDGGVQPVAGCSSGMAGADGQICGDGPR